MSEELLRDRRELAKKIAAANVELTKWIQDNPAEAQKLLIEELKAETKASFDPEAAAPAPRRPANCIEPLASSTIVQTRFVSSW